MHRSATALAAALLAAAASLARADTPVGDATQGARQVAICRACHQFGPGAHNAVGPVLNGVVGRKAGSYPGYAYSQANKSSGITWTVAELRKYLANPQGVVRGTKMIFPGFPHDPQRVDNIIAYLQTFGPDGQKVTP